MAFRRDRTSQLVILRTLAIDHNFRGHAMVSKNSRVTIKAIYDNVHLALWASLVSFLVYFATVVVPNIPAAQARFQRFQIQQIAAEHEFYCDKWGMGEHKQAHDRCILDLQAFRAKVEQRMSDNLQSDF